VVEFYPPLETSNWWQVDARPVKKMEEWLDYIRKDWHPRSHENCVTKHYDKDGKEFYPMPTASEWMPETILNNMRGYDHYITIIAGQN